jgi:hypothetical protein
MKFTRTSITLAAVLSAGMIAGGVAVAGNLSPDEPVTGPPAGICDQDQPDCDDTPNGDDYGSDFDREKAIADAEALLGLAEGELGADVRVGHKDGEDYFLTEDHVLGRMTVTLEADADGVHRVTSVTVETPDGSETVGG